MYFSPAFAALGLVLLIAAPTAAQQVPCNPAVEFCLPLPPAPDQPAPVMGR